MFIVISSNEGLIHCFPDGNTAERISRTFPVAENSAFEQRLRHCGFNEATLKAFRLLAHTNSTPDSVLSSHSGDLHAPGMKVAMDAAAGFELPPQVNQGLCAMGSGSGAACNSTVETSAVLPQRYTHSVEFFQLLALTDLEALLSQTGSRLREVLERIVLRLDLECERTFLHASLALSAALDDRDRQCLLSLVQRTVPKSQSTDWQSKLPTNLPSRLALTWMLVVANPANEPFLKAVDKVLQDAEPAKGNVSHQYFRGVYRIEDLRRDVARSRFRPRSQEGEHRPW